MPADARQDAGRRSESEAPPDGTEPVETVPEEQQEPQLSLVMTMSESDLANFLLQYLPFTPRGLSVSIGADETASMSMSVDRAELEESGLLTGHFRAAAQLLPERCSLAGKWGVRAEQGRLRFTCLSAQLNDADLPQTAAELVTDAMANALNRKLEELNVAPQRLAWERRRDRDLRMKKAPASKEVGADCSISRRSRGRRPGNG